MEALETHLDPSSAEFAANAERMQALAAVPLDVANARISVIGGEQAAGVLLAAEEALELELVDRQPSSMTTSRCGSRRSICGWSRS